MALCGETPCGPLEEDPQMLQSERDLSSLVGWALDEPARSIEPLCVGHKSTRVQQYGARAHLHRDVKQLIKDCGAHLSISPSRRDIHALQFRRAGIEHV